MPLHVTPHTERLPAPGAGALERLLARMRVCVNLQTRGAGEGFCASLADVAVLRLREGGCGGGVDVMVVLPEFGRAGGVVLVVMVMVVRACWWLRREVGW